jgi:N-acetylglucosamine kinase-like BadF-type ATPase
MKTEYIIGVDGGGTKTDYLLLTDKGEWVDSCHAGSRNHEVLSEGFTELEKLIQTDLDYLLDRNAVDKTQVAAAAFGMAGIDTPSQLARINAILSRTSIKKFAVANDSILGIKAGCPSGVGICSINGTGTVASGINEDGEILQVGGIGFATGDHAGGFILASLVVRAVYDYFFRCGRKTALSGRIMSLFGIRDPSELMNVISERFYASRDFDKEIVMLLFDEANAGDETAVGIVTEAADQLARSVSGCMLGLHFKDIPEIILAGSIWTKSDCPLLMSRFKDGIFHYTGKRVNPILLKVIPAAGAAIWALELARNRPATAEQRELIIKNISLNIKH